MRTNNNFYSLEDFSYTIRYAHIKKDDIESVVKSWGETNGSSKEDAGTELSFGALLKMKSGTFIYIQGWNDYTGWGCQDGVEKWEVTGADDPIIEKQLKEYEYLTIEWEENPVDLNRWIRGETKLPDYYTEDEF